MQLLSAHAGHWTGQGTGVTVIVPPAGTVGSGEIRGGAPATREFALLDPGGLGVATATAGLATVVAVVAVNAWGDVLGADGRPLFAPAESGATFAGNPYTNTTIGVVLTDARLGKAACHLLAQSAHTGAA